MRHSIRSTLAAGSGRAGGGLAARGVVGIAPVDDPCARHPFLAHEDEGSGATVSVMLRIGSVSATRFGMIAGTLLVDFESASSISEKGLSSVQVKVAASFAAISRVRCISCLP